MGVAIKMHINARVLSRLNQIYSDRGIDILTVEGRIVLHLLENDATRVKELMFASGSSYRGFYLALERLKKKRLIRSETDPDDGRVRRIRLL